MGVNEDQFEAAYTIARAMKILNCSQQEIEDRIRDGTIATRVVQKTGRAEQILIPQGELDKLRGQVRTGQPQRHRLPPASRADLLAPRGSDVTDGDRPRRETAAGPASKDAVLRAMDDLHALHLELLARVAALERESRWLREAMERSLGARIRRWLARTFGHEPGTARETSGRDKDGDS